MELSPAARRLVILLCLRHLPGILGMRLSGVLDMICLLYTSDAADE